MFLLQLKVAIGRYTAAYGDGWRRATEAEWRNPAFQAALVQAHREGGGWALLEEPLECNDRLFVAEGNVLINGAAVVEVGCFVYGWWSASDECMRSETRLADGTVVHEWTDGLEINLFIRIGIQQLRGVYPAMMNSYSRGSSAPVAWTTTAPALGNKWVVEADIPEYRFLDNPPCLFVHD
jgi:hypothetical protein